MPSQSLAGLIPVQLEDRIVNPDLRDHSLLGPIFNPEIMTGRAPYWASGAKSSSKILIFIIQDADPQNFILSFSTKILVEWLHFRPFVLISSAPTMVRICGKSPNSDFLGQTGPKMVRIYTEKSEFYHFPFAQCLFYINKLS